MCAADISATSRVGAVSGGDAIFRVWAVSATGVTLYAADATDLRLLPRDTSAIDTDNTDYFDDATNLRLLPRDTDLSLLLD